MAASREAATDFPRCEICAGALRPGFTPGEWVCEGCEHVMLSQDRRGGRVRACAWGGDERLDRVRLALTWLRLRRMLPGEREPVLEIGHGRGLLLERVQARGYEVHGVERNLLGPTLRPRCAGPTFHDGEIEAVDLPGTHFSLVYGIHVIEHLRDPREAFLRIARAMKPGAKAFFLTPNARSAGRTAFRDAWWNYEDPTHVRFFSPESIRRLLSDTGFERIDVRRPWLDSVTLEATSLLRRRNGTSAPHGILASRAAKLTALALVPPGLLARLIWPALRPSLAITAVRSG